jgi:dihydroorotate dehydrogenase (fumarate)
MSFFEQKYPYMNAACSVAKTLDDVKALSATDASAVVIGSITPLERSGNEEPRWYTGEGFALNAFGMPNGGLDWYDQNLPEMIQIVHDSGKKCILSIAGFSKQDYVYLATLGEKHGVDALELNFGCPNVSVDGTPKPIVSFDKEAIRDNVLACNEVAPTTPLVAKVSPYSNPGELKSVAAVLSQLPIVAVTTMNTMPNSYWEESDESVLKPNGGFGGMSGEAVLPIALGQVKMMRAELPETIEVWGVGGIHDPVSAQKMFKSGASAIQAATLIVREGHSALDQIRVEKD